jgi:hypothetical protein
MGGVMEAACLQPIDVIKTRLQLDKAGKYHGELETWLLGQAHQAAAAEAAREE